MLHTLWGFSRRGPEWESQAGAMSGASILARAGWGPLPIQVPEVSVWGSSSCPPVLVYRFMPPDDPLGRRGPTLSNFLSRKPKPPEPSWQHCPYGE